MWVIDKVNKVQRQQLEKIVKLSTVDEEDLGSILDAYPVLRDNEVFAMTYINGNIVDNISALMNLKEISKDSIERQDLHEERLNIANELWEVKLQELKDMDIDILGYRNWSCEGDTYTMPFDYCYNDDEEGQTLNGDGKVIFDKGHLTVQEEIWEID